MLVFILLRPEVSCYLQIFSHTPQCHSLKLCRLYFYVFTCTYVCILYISVYMCAYVYFFA